jgi:hypothetical protein
LKRRFEYLLREKLEWNLKNSKGKQRRSLGRAFSTKHPPTYLVESSNLHRGCVWWFWEDRGESSVWRKVKPSEMIEEREREG